MSVLSMDSDTFNIKLGSVLRKIDLIVDYKRTTDWYAFGKQVDYVNDKKEELKKMIENLDCHRPKGTDLRRCIWEVFGLWLCVRTDGKTLFGEGSYLTKYYEITTPPHLDPNGRRFKEFELKGKDDIVYKHISISLTFEMKAPHDGYKF